jgi:hypothetical protein
MAIFTGKTMINQWIKWGVAYFQTPAGGKQQVIRLKAGIAFIWSVHKWGYPKMDG